MHYLLDTMGEIENPKNDESSFSDGELEMITHLTKLRILKNRTGKLIFYRYKNADEDWGLIEDFFTPENYNKLMGAIAFFKYFLKTRAQIPEFRDLKPLNVAVKYPLHYWRTLLTDYINTEQPKFGKICVVGFNFKHFVVEVFKHRAVRIVRQAIKGVRGFKEPRLNNFELTVLEFVERKQQVIQYSMAKFPHEVERNGNRWLRLYDWELMNQLEKRINNTDACQRSRFKKRVESQAKRNGILFSEKENQYFVKLLIYSYQRAWDLECADGDINNIAMVSSSSSSSNSYLDHYEQIIYTDSDYVSGSPDSSNSNESEPVRDHDYYTNFSDEDEDSTDSYSTESCNQEGFNNLQQECYNNLQQDSYNNLQPESYNNLQEESYNPEIYCPEIHIAESYKQLQQENTDKGNYNPFTYHTIKQENYNAENYNNLQQENYMKGSFNTDSNGAIFCKQEIIDEYFFKDDNGADFCKNPGNNYLDNEYCMDVDISWLA